MSDAASTDRCSVYFPLIVREYVRGNFEGTAREEKRKELEAHAVFNSTDDSMGCKLCRAVAVEERSIMAEEHRGSWIGRLLRYPFRLIGIGD